MNKFRELIDEEIRRDEAEREKNGLNQLIRQEGGHNIGDFIRAVLKINDEDTARQFYEGEVDYLNNQPDLSPIGAEAVARANIGFCFGEGMNPEQIKMWNQVCEASHPWFGTKLPSPEEAFEVGIKAAGGP